MDFEAALLNEGTFVLKEGVDVSSLGVDSSPTPPVSEFSSPAPLAKDQRTPRLAVPPATPTVVPPTPSPTPGPSTIRPPSSSPSTSSNELYYDAEDGDMQTKRRSLYRSPGTASSPDLATLLRKAKERGGIVNVPHRKERRLEVPPPLPTGGTRPRSSTSSAISPVSSHSSVQKGVADLGPGVDSINGTEWTSPAPRPRKLSKDSKSGSKNLPPKRSVRAKTSAFLGRIMGQGTVRERSVSVV
jgi:PH and SEC7 domain-containing protein